VRTDDDAGIGGFGCRQCDTWIEDSRGMTVCLPDAPSVARAPVCMRRALHPLAPHGRQYADVRKSIGAETAR
jgi:hypothetical protein